MSEKPKTQTRRPVTGTTSAAPGGVVRRRRDPGRSLRDSSKGIPSNDFTLTNDKINHPIALVKPKWTGGGSLIFRPVASWNPDTFNETGKLVHDLYRYGIEPRNFGDFVRKYPGAEYIGEGDAAVTFNLWDPVLDETEYDPATNPYVLLQKAVDRAVYKDKTHMEWLPLIDKKAAPEGRPIIKKVVDFFYFQGPVFRNAKTAFFGPGKLPRGLGEKDYIQIIRLKNSAGRGVLELLNEVNEAWDGDPSDYEHSMLHGDPVALKHGRFITVYRADGGEDPEEQKRKLEGLSGTLTIGEEEKQSRDRDDEDRGYAVRIDKFLTVDGVATKMPASFTHPGVVKRVNERTVWFDDAIRVPSNEEQAFLIARAIPYRDVIEYAWADHPEYLTDDVNKALSKRTAALVNGSAGGAASAKKPGNRAGASAVTALMDADDLGAAFEAATETAEVEVELDVAGEELGYEEVDTGEGADEPTVGDDAEFEGEYEEDAAGETEYEEDAGEGGEEVDAAGETEYEEDAGEGEYEEEEPETADAEEYVDPDDAGAEDLPPVDDEPEYEEEVEVEASEADQAKALEAIRNARQRSAPRSATAASPTANPPAKPVATAAKPAAAAKPVGAKSTPAVKPAAVAGTKPAAAAKPPAAKPPAPKPAGGKPKAK